MHKLIYRPFVIIGLVLGLSLIVALSAMSSMTWRNQQRINTIKQDIEQGNRLQQLVFDLLEHQKLEENSSTSKKQQAEVHHKIISLIDDQYLASNNTREALKKIQSLLISVEQG
ncbi:secreted protein, partial [methanotrophic bacterial endosymbiont of Bathymodiolus sp.]